MATGDLHKKFYPVVPEICSQTDGQADCNTPLPYRGGVMT